MKEQEVKDLEVIFQALDEESSYLRLLSYAHVEGLQNELTRALPASYRQEEPKEQVLAQFDRQYFHVDLNLSHMLLHQVNIK